MKKSLTFALAASFVFLLGIKVTLAVTLEDCEKNPSSNVSECITIFSKKVSELGTQKKTLASQIAQFDTQIKVTQLKINDAQSTIAQLEKEIGILGFRIGYVTESIDKLENLVKERIVATYQQSFVSDLELVMSSNGFSDILLKLQYLKQVQENDKKILASLQETRSNYANQKDEREAKQAAIEEQKTKLEALKVDLDKQKADKQVFLQITKNDETRYQRLLAQAQAEIAIAFGGGKETFIRDIKQGDVIGSVIMGQSGCSSGTHLHFETHKNGSIEDPNNYLNSSTSYNYWNGDEAGVGSINPRGNLPWPLNAPIQINQGFGMTPYANSGSYDGKPHYGIDMSNGPSVAAPVKAVKDGKLYGGSYGGCRYGSLIYARIKHDDGLDTLYLHMIPN